jgi:aldehyde:ferredoxin oxidoreductase
LVLTIGPLAGCGIPGAERLSAGGKSPLTLGIKESNAGGTFGHRLAALGVRAIVVEGKSSLPAGSILHVTADGASFLSAEHLAGTGVYETARKLRTEFGDDAGLALVGPAGEQLLAAAGIFVTDIDGAPGRACARGGLGALMAAKGLKAIVVTGGSQRRAVSDRQGLRSALAALVALVRETPQTAHGYRTLGTAGSVRVLDALGGLPTRNFTAGSFERADSISGERLRELVEARGGDGKMGHRCMPGCIVSCSNVFPDARGKAVVAPLEYETIGMLGSNLDIADLDAIARLNYLANDVGVDTIEVGVTLGMAIDKGLLAYGDAEAAAGMLREIGQGTILGRVLGSGAVVAGKVLGITRVPAVRGQGIPAHEPRGIKGMIHTYAMSPMGADHTAATTFRAHMDHRQGAGHMEFNRLQQIRVAGFDSLGMCLFTTPALGKKIEIMAELMNAVHGAALGPDYLMELGKETLKYERAFNLAAGYDHDRLPEFMALEPLAPFGLVADAPESELDGFWDPEFWGPLPALGPARPEMAEEEGQAR